MPEQLIPFSEVPKMLPARRGGKLIHLSTLFRWSNHGLGGHRLRFVKVGGQPCTTRAWLDQFFQAVAQGDNAPSTPPSSPPTSRRKLDVEAQLDQLGI